jgi:hypothetical protein
MASGQHDKNKLLLGAMLHPSAAAEAGLQYEYAFGEFEPDFGGGFVPQRADRGDRARQQRPWSARSGSPAASAAGTAWRSASSTTSASRRS